MKTVLLDLFTSKKFLAALAAVTIYLGGRFGFEIDPAALDHIFAALLVYVGAQGAADIGKSAAKINAGVANSNIALASADAMKRAASSAATLLVLVLAIGAAGMTSACTGAQRAAGVSTLIDCTTTERAATVDSLGEALKSYALKYVSGDGRSIDLAKLKSDALALKGEVLGSCGLAAALAILAQPKPPGERSLLAEPTPEQWREAFVAVRAELGVGAVRGG